MEARLRGELTGSRGIALRRGNAAIRPRDRMRPRWFPRSPTASGQEDSARRASTLAVEIPAQRKISCSYGALQGDLRDVDAVLLDVHPRGVGGGRLGVRGRGAAPASSLSCSCAAGSRSSSCSGVRGPMIGAVTPGCASSHAIATCGTVAPRLGGDRLGLLHGGEVALGRRAGGSPPRRRRRRRRCASPPAARRPAVAAREEPGAQRAPGDHAEPGGAAEGQQLDLDRALDERVLRLQRDERRPAVAVLQRDGPGQQPRGVVRGAQRAHLAGAHEPVERLERLLERHVGIGRVHLVEVDHVDAEPAQARVARARGCGRARGPGRRGRRPRSAPWWRARRRRGAAPATARASRSDSPSPYVSAVSTNGRPASTNASSIRWPRPRGVLPPMSIVPRQRRLTASGPSWGIGRP